MVFRSQQVMGQAQPRWVLESSLRFSFPGTKRCGIRNYSEFLVLETISRDSSAARKKNDREVFLPIRPKRDLTSVVASPVAENTEIVSCVSIKIKNDNLDPKDPKSTCYLAYPSPPKLQHQKSMRKQQSSCKQCASSNDLSGRAAALVGSLKLRTVLSMLTLSDYWPPVLLHENFTMYPQVKKENVNHALKG